MKISIFRIIVLSTHFYGCGTRVFVFNDLMKIERLGQHKLYTILRIQWNGHITDEEILFRVVLSIIETTMTQRQPGMSKHMILMSETHLRCQPLCAELTSGA